MVRWPQDNPMEDVLLAYLRSRQQGPADAVKPSSKVSDSSWRIPAAEKDPCLKSTLPCPLCAIVALVDGHKDYAASSRQLAELLKKVAGTHPLDEVMLQVLNAKMPRIWMERFLLILL